MNVKIVTIAILVSVTGVFAQNMSRNAAYSLFSDQKAVTVGDAITINVVESSQASNNAEKSTGKSSDVGFNLSGAMDATTLPSIDFGAGSNNDFDGKGSTRTSGLIRTTISALVDSVYSNGNLRVRGRRKLVINGEEQNVFITGIVRTSDIRSDNSIYSYNISEAEIRLEGNGMIEDSQSPGWLTKLFHFIF
ncbi:MAG: flagellar basal body L-ring protein FlgH [Bacteroidetes bacterium]|nr:flagellar basal body L-ring protein FlgH [Bacteroidota bacterium]